MGLEQVWGLEAFGADGGASGSGGTTRMHDGGAGEGASVCGAADQHELDRGDVVGGDFYGSVDVSTARQELFNYLVHLKESGSRMPAKALCEICWWIGKSFNVSQLP